MTGQSVRQVDGRCNKAIWGGKDSLAVRQIIQTTGFWTASTKSLGHRKAFPAPARKVCLALVTLLAVLPAAVAQYPVTSLQPSAWSTGYPHTGSEAYDVSLSNGPNSPDPAAVTPTAYLPYATAPTTARNAPVGRGYAPQPVPPPAPAYPPVSYAHPVAPAAYANPGYTAYPNYAYPTQPVQPVAQPVAYNNPPVYAPYAARPAAPVRTNTPAYPQVAARTPVPGYQQAGPAARPVSGYRVAQNVPVYPTGPAPDPATVTSPIAPTPASPGPGSGYCPDAMNYGYGGCQGGCGGCAHGDCWENGIFGWRFGDCNLVQHHAYYPAMHGYYYLRPYHHEHVPLQQAFTTSFGADMRNPYSNDFFKAIYAEYRASQREPAMEEVPRPLPSVMSTR